MLLKNLIKKRGPAKYVSARNGKICAIHTESDDDGNQNSSPEGELAKQYHNLVDEVDTLEK